MSKKPESYLKKSKKLAFVERLDMRNDVLCVFNKDNQEYLSNEEMNFDIADPKFDPEDIVKWIQKCLNS